MQIVFALVLALVGLLFFTAHRGLTTGRLGPNYMLGLRTPATTANADVWRAAHKDAADIYSFAWKLPLMGAGLLLVWSFLFIEDQSLLVPALVFIFFLVDVVIVYFVSRGKADSFAKKYLEGAGTH